ncbi:hypothetical protein GW750_02985 [bacterium]|nr:hypothetical protein [bacterium]
MLDISTRYISKNATLAILQNVYLQIQGTTLTLR